MPRFLCESTVPQANQISALEWAEITQQSYAVLQEMGPEIQWVKSYVTDDGIYCTYIAANEELVREHARRSGFTLERVMRVSSIIDPTTAGA